MQLNVDLLPRTEYPDVVVVIDVLRTCTVAPILFDRGLEALTLTPSLRAARAAAATGAGDTLLVGERQGLPPEGFNYGNSPAELVRVHLTGKHAVLVSENAPAALPRVAGARHVLLGSLYNAGAVARLASELASERVDLVCCGFRGEEDLDDAITAGVLIAELAGLAPEARIGGAGRLTMALLHAYPDPLEALWTSVAGRYLRGLELEQDIGMAARLSHSDVVPSLTGHERIDEGELFRFTAIRPA
jgi:2-phosphosulfolactate phosphatase